MNLLRNLYMVFSFSLAGATVVLFSSCGEEIKPEVDIPQEDVTVTDQTTIFKMDNKLFYMPNPVQTATLIKKISVGYQPELLNPVENTEKYNTSFKQAINIGIYGTDMAYISTSGQNQDAMKYLSAVKKLSDALGLSAAFKFDKFEGKTSDQNSMLSLTTDAYRDCQRFLREGDRNDIAALLLAGAWLEGLYFSTNIAKKSRSPEVLNRVGEQKASLDNVILLLNPHYDKTNAPELSEFVDKLVDLQTTFENVVYEYTFIQSSCDAPTKVCKIQSTSKVQITEGLLDAIIQKAQQIREKLII